VLPDEVMELVDRLPFSDKVRLIGRLAPQIAGEAEPVAETPRQSLRGLWRGVDITDEDLAEVREEMWAAFPRDDV